MSKSTLVGFVSLVAAMAALGCSEEKETPSGGLRQTDAGSAQPNDPDDDTDDPDGSETLTLSASFASTCTKCHGAEGKGQNGYPSIPGNKTESAFIAIVRSGSGDMPATSASQFSDADLKSDYLWLTTKRP
ncbi:MAG: cytochrome c [Labilithrix sp.]|nr:cytochrome c [Labilithrix sp.]